LAGFSLYIKKEKFRSIGDEIMCKFPTAGDAVEAAVEMQPSLEDMPLAENTGYGSPNIYVGIQFGPIIRGGGDDFGDAVNYGNAFRIASNAWATRLRSAWVPIWPNRKTFSASGP
jgi:adenylate cyclase